MLCIFIVTDCLVLNRPYKLFILVSCNRYWRLRNTLLFKDNKLLPNVNSYPESWIHVFLCFVFMLCLLVTVLLLHDFLLLIIFKLFYLFKLKYNTIFSHSLSSLYPLPFAHLLFQIHDLLFFSCYILLSTKMQVD